MATVEEVMGGAHVERWVVIPSRGGEVGEGGGSKQYVPIVIQLLPVQYPGASYY